MHRYAITGRRTVRYSQLALRAKSTALYQAVDHYCEVHQPVPMEQDTAAHRISLASRSRRGCTHFAVEVRSLR